MKLFGKNGKLNIIDILILLVLAAAIVFAVVKLAGHNEANEAGTNTALSEPNLRFEMTTDEVSETLAESIRAALAADKTKIGDVEAEAGRIFNGDKLVDACVTGVTVEPGEAEGTCVLHFTVEAKATTSSGHYSVGTQEVRLGKELYLKTLDVEIVATVDRMEKLS